MRNTETIGREKFTGGESVIWRRLPLAVLLAAGAAIVANIFVYLTASALGFISPSVFIPTTGGETPLTVGMVAITSVIGTVGAAAVFAVIGLFTQRPTRLFRIIAVIVLVLSFAMPLTITGAPMKMILSMEAIHVVAWATIVGLLTTVVREKASV